ncbi:MAG: transporter substrate-binding domain-containing protein [Campylobacterota bacterium]
MKIIVSTLIILLLNSLALLANEDIKLTKKQKDFIKNRTINIAYTDSWEPMSFEQNGKPYGLGFDFWDYIVKKTGIKSNFIFKNSFTKALNDIKNKKTDIIITTSKTKDREKYAVFSDIYFQAPIGIATLQNKNYIANFSELFNKKVGVGENYSSHKLLKQKYPKMEFVTVNSVQEGLSLLSSNQIYAFVDNIPVLVHNIQKHSYSNIKISGDTKVNFNLQMMIRDDYEILRDIINKVLSNMSPEDKKKIYNKWSKIEYTQKFDYSVLWKYFLPLFIIIAVILYKNRQLIIYQRSLKRTQVDLENSVNSFKTLINLTIEGIVIIKDKKILFYNDEFLKMFNINIKNIKDIDINSLFSFYNGYSLQKVLQMSKIETYETMGIKKSNKRFPVMIKSKSIMYNKQKCDIITIIDMSDIKNKENLLIQQSKMASLGEMIGNIAHQWRQPLSLISTAATGMKLQKEFDTLDDKTFNSTIDDISKTTLFLSQTIDDFQNYLKTNKTKEEFNIEDSIQKVLNIVKSSFINNSIELIKNIENISIVSYENELNQVLLNILNNSKDALKQSDLEDKFIQINTKKSKDYMSIQVVDNGGGIEPNVLRRVFDPYFTTKHQSQGTGLGLYMTHKIINESLNGSIEISNIEYKFDGKYFEKCTQVEIRLPFS